LLGIKINDNFTDHIQDVNYEIQALPVDSVYNGPFVFRIPFFLFEQGPGRVMQGKQHVPELQPQEEQKQVFPEIQL
jgi:hypothetical protein